MTSSRPRDVGGSFASRRGHASQLSISDPSHHVTETIGTLYGDDDDGDYSSAESRPASLTAQPYVDKHSRKPQQPEQQRQQQRPDMNRRQSDGQQVQQQQQGLRAAAELTKNPRSYLTRTTSDNLPTTSSITPNSPPPLTKSQTLPTRIPSQRNNSYEGPKSPMTPPSPSLRDVQADEHGSQFPLTQMDNPNDIAQEFSNLQALRRMSMDVGNLSDPDLLPFSSVSLMPMPSTAPQGDDDEGDPSRLLWVPARVHPELDTNAFKNFLENRVQSMKRRSGESMLSMEGVQMDGSGSLRRKKSMLSRQITRGTDGDDYVDGAERLQRKGSQSIPPIPEVSLDELVKDPTKVVQKLTQDTRQDGASSESGLDTDIIIPAAPGMGLRRSTRTTYRKGGSLRGERVPFARRMAERKEKAAEPEDTSAMPPAPAVLDTAPPAPPGHSLKRVQSEPIDQNFSRPSRSVKRQQNFSSEAPAAMSPPTISPPTTPDDATVNADAPTKINGGSEDKPDTAPEPKPRTQQLPYRTSSAMAQRATPVPQIVETPPPPEETSPSEERPPSRPFPERSSSQKSAQQAYPSQPQQPEEPPARSNKRPGPGSAGQPLRTPSSTAQSTSAGKESATSANQTVVDMANHPSPLPGGGASRTDSLTFIPTYDEKKLKKDKDDTESISSTKSSAWKWFKGDKEDKKKKEKEREREEQAKKAAKGKSEKAHGDARLDVLQSSIDNVVAKGRESLLLDRESIDNKLTEERKKESTRKTSDTKKEKDGFFGGLFGTKKKSDKEQSSKKKEQRALSPEPPSRPLRPDIDYPWSRFTIIEERAIYRMAHIKLANPRRSLQSQVLLSNFMYSYLAKVQAMHPQIQVPISPQQKRLEEERKRKEAEQQQRILEQQMAEQQAAQQDGNFNFEYHRSGNQQYGNSPVRQGDYIDDSETYAYDHQGEENGNRLDQNGAYHNTDTYDSGHSRQGSGGHDYYYGQGNPYDDDDDDERHMW